MPFVSFNSSTQLITSCALRKAVYLRVWQVVCFISLISFDKSKMRTKRSPIGVLDEAKNHNLVTL